MFGGIDVAGEASRSRSRSGNRSSSPGLVEVDRRDHRLPRKVQANQRKVKIRKNMFLFGYVPVDPVALDVNLLLSIPYFS